MSEPILTLTHTSAVALILLPYTVDTHPGEPRIRWWFVSPGEGVPRDVAAFIRRKVYEDFLEDYPHMTYEEFIEELSPRSGKPLVFLIGGQNQVTVDADESPTGEGRPGVSGPQGVAGQGPYA